MACQQIYNQFALSLLTCFVDNSAAFFGRQFVSLAVHSLLHLPDECRRIGPLDEFSCWKYENALKTLKKRCKNYKHPIQALANQLRYKSSFMSKPSRVLPSSTYGVSLIRPHLGYLTDGVKLIDGQSYKTAFYRNYVLTLTPPDCYFMSFSKQIYQILDIVLTKGSGTKLICKQFVRTESAFYVPTDEHRFEASELGIHLLLSRCETVHCIDIEDFKWKCVIRHYIARKAMCCYPIIPFDKD